MLDVQPVLRVRVDYGPFINLIDALECPSLEKFSAQWGLNDILADSWISFFKRSGSRLKELKLHRILNFQTSVEDFKKLYNAVPFLSHLDLHWNEGSLLTTLDDFFQQLSSSAPVLEGGTLGFLPNLESLTVRLNTLDFRSPAGAGRHIPCIYSCPHRKFLSLELRLREIEIDDPALTKLSNLIDEGVNIRILKDGEDYFQKIHAQQPSLADLDESDI
jgi:hypothetical protein